MSWSSASPFHNLIAQHQWQALPVVRAVQGDSQWPFFETKWKFPSAREPKIQWDWNNPNLYDDQPIKGQCQPIVGSAEAVSHTPLPVPMPSG